MVKAIFAPTAEQKAVISHRGGHLQVIACAGAGKTEAISRRVSSLIEEGVEPSQIVAFTFTERAAASLKTRITKRVAEIKGTTFLDRLGPMFVGTIHAYCLRMLQDHVPEFGNFDILDENRLAGLLSREHKRLELGKIGPQHWRPIFDFLRNADVMENELLDPAPLKGTPFGDCYLAFKQTLFRYHFLTYGLLISAAVKALHRPEVFDRVHGGLKHLIVDEYQDVNPAQEKLIALLAQPPVHLCVVADDDQAIYQWRGSDVSNMLEFAERYSATPLLLSVNRRSRPTIIVNANSFAASISPRLPKKMEPHRLAEGTETHAWSAETVEAEAEFIADTIERLHQRGFRYKDVAILFRSVRTSSPPLIDEFKARGIPFRCAGRTGLFLQPEARVLGKTYAWLSKNDWKNERYGQSQPVEIDPLVTEYKGAFNAGNPIDGLREYLTDWQAMVGDTAGQVNLVRDFYRLLRVLGVHDLDLDEPAGSACMGCLARFSQILADYEHVTRRSRYVDEEAGKVFRGGQDRGTWYYQRLFNYLQYYALDAYEDFEGEDTFDLDAVDILTVHQSKGLEWPVVFLPGLVEGRFPSRYAGQPQDWLIDESVFTPAMRLDKGGAPGLAPFGAGQGGAGGSNGQSGGTGRTPGGGGGGAGYFIQVTAGQAFGGDGGDGLVVLTYQAVAPPPPPPIPPQDPDALISIARAKYDIPEAQGNTTYDAFIATLITVASQLIQKFCARNFLPIFHDELYNGEGDRRLLLRDYPILEVRSVRYRPVTVLKVINSDTATNQQARVRVRRTGLTLERVASGATYSDNTIQFKTYATLNDVATAINALGNGWSAQVVGDTNNYGAWPSGDLYCINGTTAEHNAGQGNLTAWGQNAELKMHTYELAGYQINARRGWLLRAIPYTDPELLHPEDLVWPVGINNLRVQYFAGYDAVPAPIQEACARLVTTFFHQAGKDALVASETNPQYAYAYLNQGLVADIPPAVRALLEPYRRYTFSIGGG